MDKLMETAKYLQHPATAATGRQERTGALQACCSNSIETFCTSNSRLLPVFGLGLHSPRSMHTLNSEGLKTTEARSCLVFQNCRRSQSSTWRSQSHGAATPVTAAAGGGGAAKGVVAVAAETALAGVQGVTLE